LVVIALLTVAAVGCLFRPKSQYLIPDKEDAKAQYYFAAQFEEQQRQRPIADTKELYRPIIEAYQKVVDRFPDDQVHTPLALLDIGERLFTLKSPDKALRYFDTAYKRYPDNHFVQARSIFLRGRCHEALGRNEKARDHYKDCVDLYSGHPDKLIKETVAEARALYDRVMKR
jgi:tetratricopeptide (TPR) repeat protein